MAPREDWTDERLDELSSRTEKGFSEVKAEFRGVRAELGEMRTEIGQVREGLGEVRAEVKGLGETMEARMEAMNRTLQVGFGLIGSFLGVLGVIIATQL